MAEVNVIQRRRVWLAMVVVAALFRGLFWLLTGPIFNPIDEAQHFGFVSAISRGHGIPNVHDSLPREVLELAKASPTLPFHSTPVTPDDPDDPRWGVFAKQYEAMQGPAYYALMVPAYWLGRPFGALGSLYAVRAASLALVLLAIPLTYCLTVQLFPGRHRIALGATVILVAIQSFTANAATVTNDALVAPLTLAVLLAGLAFFEKPSTRRALILGTMVGVGFLTKGTFLFVVILLALLAVLPPHRKRLWGALAPAAIASIVALLLVAPWLYWNHLEYGALTGADAAEQMLKPLLPNLPFGLDAVRAHLAGTRSGLWRFQAAVDSRSPYELFWEAAAAALVALACVAATRRRAWQDLARIAWLGVAPVVAFATVLAVDYLGAAGRSGVTGRHLIGTVPLLAIAMATGADVLGCRWISVLLTGVVAASLAMLLCQAAMSNFASGGR